MFEDHDERTKEGGELLREHLSKVYEQAQLFLSAVRGFRRDLTLSVQSNEHFLHVLFTTTAHGIVVPEMLEARSFSDLEEMLKLTEDAIDGKITVKNPALGPNQDDRARLVKEIDLIHQNLTSVSETAYRLYQAIQTAGFEFDVFNTKNNEVGYPDANILFDRDRLNVSAAISRALSERAVRLDIDLVESKQRLTTGQKQLRS